MQLTREIRCWLTETPSPRDERPWDEHPMNSWSGWPATDELVPFVKVRLTVAGQCNVRTGMLCDIHKIDEVVRANLRSIDRRAVWATASFTRELWQLLEIDDRLSPKMVKLELAPSPYLHYAASVELHAMIAITQQFEFSAAHRLHCDNLSAEQNRALFGKCNNPHGHGHNYVVQVTIAGTTDADPTLLPLPKLDQIVRSQVINRLDHRNLNLEVEEFANANPTVERIAQVIWQWLDKAVSPSRLQQVRVYETPKTWADVFASEDDDQTK